MKFILLPLFITVVVNAYAVDFWQHPEAAEGGSLFASAHGAVISFNEGFSLAPQASADVMLPFPLSLGAFLKMPEPNLNSFGIRLAYHINLDRPNTDLYALYVFDFGFVRNDLLVEYNDQPVDIRYYDFRAGIRQRINQFLFIHLESDFKFQGFFIGLSMKVL